MKKIVALVLSLVMVLGLATTAFAAADKEWTNLYGKYTTNVDGIIALSSVQYFKAVAPTYDEDGLVNNDPAIAYYLCADLTGASALVEVATLGEADIVLYNDAAGKVVFKYLKKVANVEYEGLGVAFNDFGKSCGQYLAKPAADAKYYVFENAVYQAATASDTCLMVDGKLVPVTALASDFVDHVASYTYNEKFEVTAVKCGVCGKVATIVPNYASIPATVTEFYGPINDVMYFYWGATEAPAADATVESAKTFDAGIAMYVGMSVMAAAGSAVVLKKKD